MSDNELEKLLEELNEVLPVDLTQTYEGRELKGWCTDRENGGITDFYLDKFACVKLQEFFGKLAQELGQREKKY